MLLDRAWDSQRAPLAEAAKCDALERLTAPQGTLASSLKVVAVASEENALKLWAAFPDKNPHSSAQITSPAGQDRSFGDFAPTQRDTKDGTIS